MLSYRNFLNKGVRKSNRINLHRSKLFDANNARKAKREKFGSSPFNAILLNKFRSV